jgi:putative glutamine amidotransferase
VVPLQIPDAGPAVARLVERFTVSALRLLARAGADPWVVDSSSPDRPPPSAVAAADGVLLLGGGDLDPVLYGVTGPVPDLYGVDRDADAHALDVVRGAVGTGTPVFGVCRGAQVLNVALGGTLVPHLDGTGTHRGATAEQLFIDEEVTLEPRSWVADVLGRTRVTVRSGHHQAVDRPGAGLRAVAWAVDGVVEGIEHDSAWALGVQWHPEDTDGSHEDGAALFGSFVDAVRLGRGAALSVVEPS